MEFTILNRYQGNIFFSRNSGGICGFGSDHSGKKFSEGEETRGDVRQKDITSDLMPLIEEIRNNSSDYAVFQTSGSDTLVLAPRNLEEDYFIEICALSYLQGIHKQISSLCPEQSGVYNKSRNTMARLLHSFEGEGDCDVLSGLVDFKNRTIIAKTGYIPIIDGERVTCPPHLVRLVADKCGVSSQVVSVLDSRYPQRYEKVRALVREYLKQTFFTD